MEEKIIEQESLFEVIKNTIEAVKGNYAKSTRIKDVSDKLSVPIEVVKRHIENNNYEVKEKY